MPPWPHCSTRPRRAARASTGRWPCSGAAPPTPTAAARRSNGAPPRPPTTPSPPRSPCSARFSAGVAASRCTSARRGSRRARSSSCASRTGPACAAATPTPTRVQRVQEALLALPAKTGRSYDLGEKGADGVYGSKTAAAVVKFKTDEALGSTQFDDVGPGTMRRLDELFAGGDGPLPPCPVPIQGGGLRCADRQVHQPRLHRRPGKGGSAPGDRRSASRSGTRGS